MTLLMLMIGFWLVMGREMLMNKNKDLAFFLKYWKNRTSSCMVFEFKKKIRTNISRTWRSQINFIENFIVWATPKWLKSSYHRPNFTPNKYASSIYPNSNIWFDMCWKESTGITKQQAEMINSTKKSNDII